MEKQSLVHKTAILTWNFRSPISQGGKHPCEKFTTFQEVTWKSIWMDYIVRPIIPDGKIKDCIYILFYIHYDPSIYNFLVTSVFHLYQTRNLESHN